MNNLQKKKQAAAVLTSYTVSVPGFTQKAGSEVFIPSALIPYNLENSFGRSVTRENDLFVGEYRESKSIVTYHLPKGMEVRSLPKDCTVAFGGMSLSFKFLSQNRNECTVISNLTTARSYINKNDYEKLKEFLSACAVIESTWIVVSAGEMK